MSWGVLSTPRRVVGDSLMTQDEPMKPPMLRRRCSSFGRERSTHSKRSKMDPLLLGFTDAAMERRFDESTLRTTLSQRDNLVMTLSTPFVLSLVLGSLWRSLDPGKRVTVMDLELALTSALSCLLLSLFWAVQWRWGIQGMLKWRTQLVVAFRISISTSLALSMHKFHWMYELKEQHVLAALDALVINEVVGALVIGFGLRLKFRHHVLTSFISIVALFLGKGNTFCENITCSPEGHVFMLTERLLDRCAARVLGWLQQGFGDSLPRDRDRDHCFHLSMFIHLFFAFGMVSYFIWLNERRSRVNFVIEHFRDDSRGLSPVHHIPVSTHIQCGAIILVAFGVTWEFLSRVGGGLASGGVEDL